MMAMVGAEIVRKGLAHPNATNPHFPEILFDNTVIGCQDPPFLDRHGRVPVPDLIGDSGKLFRRIGIKRENILRNGAYRHNTLIVLKKNVVLAERLPCRQGDPELRSAIGSHPLAAPQAILPAKGHPLHTARFTLGKFPFYLLDDNHGRT